MADAHQAQPRSTASDRQPRPARATAYLLGGRVHSQADRSFAESLVARWPRWTADLRTSESFLTSTLRGEGFDQVIDLSPVLPTPDGPYGTFRAVPRVRLVRLDGDPVTAAQSAALLRGTIHRVIQRDPHDPDAALAVIHRRRLLDLHRPVVLLAGCGALEGIPTQSALEDMLSAWGRQLPDGSRLVFTHDSDDARTPAEVRAARAARARYTSLGTEFIARRAVAVELSLHNAGWTPTEPLHWAALTHAHADGPAAARPGQPDGRLASVVAGIADNRKRHRVQAKDRETAVVELPAPHRTPATSRTEAWFG